MSSATTQLQALLDQFDNRLAFVEAQLGVQAADKPQATGSGASQGDDKSDVPSVVAYDKFSAPLLADFTDACNKLGGSDMQKCAELVSTAWAFQRTFIVTASKCKKPAQQQDEIALMKPIMDAVQEAGRSVRRGEDSEFHFKAVQEGLTALNWLLMPSDVRDWIESQVGSMDYSGNKIRLKYKRKTENFDENQHMFCDALKKLISGLIPYTKEHHFRCVTWNPRGNDLSSFTPPPAPSTSAAPSSSAPKTSASASEGGPGIGDLKNALGKFQDGAKGLKKVTKDMQTWREEFKGDKSAAPGPVKKKAAPRPVVIKTKGTKRVEYEQRGMRWCVEAQAKDDGVVEVPVTDVKHSVNVYGCFQATINITGKIKGVTIDSCEQCKVLLDTAISSVELVNCKRMQIQIRGTAPTVNIDKTDGCLTYLSAETLGTTFTTAKSSEMNVAFPDPKTGDMKEAPIPEQFVHRLLFENNPPKMTAEISDLYS